MKRRTIRGFKADPVPNDTIVEVIDIARHAPSNSNTQPWHIAVVSGAPRDKLEKAIFKEINSGKKPYPTFPSGGVGLTGVYKQRQYDCAFSYYATMGIAREDVPARQALLLKNWEFFGAPHVAFLSMPETMHRANAIDIGIFLQTVMLLFVERGVSCCPQGALGSYPGPVREIADIPRDNAILCGLSFGYAQEDALINEVKMQREPLDVVASFTT
ncbi:MAG: nitroreductase [Pseudomonadales bacterium]|nr:nitroreductase [Pseudomonadales bacterium]